MLSRWLQGFAAAVPSRCAVCGEWPSQPVCAACLARFSAPRSRCRRCALPVPDGVDPCGACARHPPVLDHCHAAVDYAFPWAGLVTRFKFQAQPGWGETLAAVMARAPGIADAVAQADALVPLPLAAARLGERGFNQALELARHLAPARVDAHTLLRLRPTRPQARLPLAERHANVRHAFAVEPLRHDRVAGRHLLLVDDVMTTGASLEAAAAALKSAGAASVGAVVLARTDESR